MREAAFWEREREDRVRCTLCFHGCVLPEGGRGFCGVRVNRGGTLYTLVDDNVVSLSLDPVEKKPLYHFLPGTPTLSMGTMGCNFACAFCQNHRISRQAADSGRMDPGTAVTPGSLTDFALSRGVPSLSFTYNEPTVFWELLAPTAELAAARGLRSIMVTNGAMSAACLQTLAKTIHAANVDLKAWNPAFYRDVCRGRRDTVLDNLRAMRAMGWWLEVTTLVIPGLNDAETELRAIAAFIRDDLGADTPWHVSAFFPTYRMQDRPPTPPATIRTACRLGREEGLHFVYGGNVRDDSDARTCCPSCGAVCMTRRGFMLLSHHNGVCPACGHVLPGVWA